VFPGFTYCLAECRYAECGNVLCQYAQCRYAKCHYVECRGADGGIAEHSSLLQSITKMKRFLTNARGSD